MEGQRGSPLNQVLIEHNNNTIIQKIPETVIHLKVDEE